MTKEGGPRLEDQEQIPPPNLFEIYGDSEITVFGITGTIRSLAEKCPVDLSQVSVEAMNEFVVKAANESELEIKPEHAEVFTQVLDKKGVEPKFKVAEVSASKETEPKAKADSPVEKTNSPVEVKLEQRITENVLIEVPLDKNSGGDLKLNHRQDEANTHVPTVKVVEMINIDTVIEDSERLRSETFSTTVEELEDVESIERTVELIVKPPVLEGIIFQAERPTVSRPLVIETKILEQNEIVVADETVPKYSYLEPVTRQAELSLDNEQSFQELFSSIAGTESQPSSPTTDWETELSNSPDIIYDNFLDALSAFTELTPALPDNEISAASDGSEDLELVEPMTAPAIVLTVAERLAELEPDARESVALILKNIVGAIHGLDVLVSRGAQPERVQAVMSQLENFCVKLFENIGIDYNEADIKQFIEVMIHPDFYLTQGLKDDDNPLDLEYLGTHEVKLHFPKLLGSFVDIEASIRQALGAIALIAAKSNVVLSIAT